MPCVLEYTVRIEWLTPLIADHANIGTPWTMLVNRSIVVQYNAEAVSSGDFYQLSAKVPKGKETFDSITVNVCVSRTGVQSNGMSVVEVGVPSGFKGDISKTANNNPRYLKHIEPGFDKVVLYFDKIAGKTCFDVTAGRVDKVTQSESMPIVAYDYYEPGNMFIYFQKII
ncbi:hypothetical protein FSP39_022874 [Pinctada imbricata]|uniref:Alpha-macroglobulin receptor-binding domain-containing protein n=1 Tax=Pinctada imbricata TaxID=66713 RepID=A0AA88YFE1_PINIB|nr:hypothetical protein FSP39_022874 [Pinctada imbricata]